MFNSRRGKREAGSGSYPSTDEKPRGKKVRVRILQVVLVLAVVIGIGIAALSAWIRMPSIPGPMESDGSGMQNDPDQENPGTALEQLSGETSGEFFEGAVNPHISQSGRKEGVYTVLLVGRDVASGSTDVMLLLTYDTKAKTVNGLSLPRDTMMDVGTSSKRLNAIFNNNKGKDEATQTEKGMEALCDAVADITGILPDYYVYVRWEAIGELVDAIGGVEFEVPFNMDYDDPYQDLYIHQKAGLRTLTGNDAMQVVRWRKNNDGSNSGGGDIARISIQQDFLKAVAKKCLSPTMFLKLPDLVKIFKENVETDLTVGNILALAQKAYGMNPDTGVSFETAPIGAMVMYNGASMVTLDPDGMLEVVNEKMNPYLRDVQINDLHMLIKISGGYTVTSGKINKSIEGGRNSSVTPSSGTGNSTNSGNRNSSTSSNKTTSSSKTTTGSNKTTTGSNKTTTGSGTSGNKTTTGSSTKPSTGSGTTKPSTGSSTTKPSTGSSTGTGTSTTKPGTGSSTGTGTGSGSGTGTTNPGTGSSTGTGTGSGTGTGTGSGSQTTEPGSNDPEEPGGDDPGGTQQPGDTPQVPDITLP